MIRGLLDTQALLWSLLDDQRLPQWLRVGIDQHPTQFGVSDVSLLEIAIKSSIGKLGVAGDLPEQVEELGFMPVPITTKQVWALRELPLHHRDPFDRLLVAQAMDLGVPLVTADAALGKYDIGVLW